MMPKIQWSEQEDKYRTLGCWSCIIAASRKGRRACRAHRAGLGKRLRQAAFPTRNWCGCPFGTFSLAGACCNRDRFLKAEGHPSKDTVRRPSHSPILQMLGQINQGQRMCFVIKNQEQDWRSGKSSRPGASLSSCFPYRRPASSRAFQRNLCLV